MLFLKTKTKWDELIDDEEWGNFPEFARESVMKAGWSGVDAWTYIAPRHADDYFDMALSIMTPEK